MIWSRKAAAVPPPSRSRLAGVDLTASRTRALVGPADGVGPLRPLALDGNAEEFALALDCRQRAPRIGAVAAGLARRLPHAITQGFLPALLSGQTFGTGRQPPTAEQLLRWYFEALRSPLASECDAAVLATPAYLSAAQVQQLHLEARAAKLPVIGSAAAPLAIVAYRLGKESNTAAGDTVPVGEERAGGSSVLPQPMTDVGNIFDHSTTGGVVVVDVDHAGLSASAVELDGDECSLVGTAFWPKLGSEAWTDRILAGVCDRCVRVARRDPRDSAEAEQSLVDQFPAALLATAEGRSTILGVRVGHWYQELLHRPEELTAYTQSLARQAGGVLREFIWRLPMPTPPRSIWLTASAFRQPGLAAALHSASPERTSIEPLGETAPAEAALALAVRIRSGQIPSGHYDTRLALGIPSAPAPPPRDAHPFANRKPGEDRPRLFTQSG